VIGTQDIHAGDVQAHDPRGPHGSGPLFRRDLDQFRRSATMQVRAKLSLLRLAHHRCHHFFADDEAADVGAACFLDELLHQEVRIQAAECLDHAFGRLARFREYHAFSLRALEQLQYDGCATDQVQQVVGVVGRIGKARDRQAYALA
jgi:hypothetical protein